MTLVDTNVLLGVATDERGGHAGLCISWTLPISVVQC